MVDLVKIDELSMLMKLIWCINA